MRFISLLVCLLFLQLSTNGQIAKTQVVRLQAQANMDGSITLNWPAEVYTGTFDIYKRLSQSTEDWGANFIASVPGNQNSYKDATVTSGQAFEYMVVKRRGATNDALGYIYAGNKLAEPKQFQGMILLIDSNYLIPLASEINTLISDLTNEGWLLTVLPIGRSQAVSLIKSKILSTFNSAAIKPSSLTLLGHIPVPYAGFYSSSGEAPPPDGHIEGSGNHTGAWAADVYYGILQDVFTDNSVNCTTGALTRNHNKVGDGKFDQTKLPGRVDLEVGRIDLFEMPTFGKSDTVLMRNYLNRNHAWRTGAWKVTERAVIDNNFTSLNLASTGYANFSTLVGSDSVFDNRDYFSAQRNGSYLWSFGCGAGSYTSCSGVGNTASFVNDSFQNVFTILSGSFFGDYDIQNNFLRAPLASKSLASFWGGIPKWYVHHMGLGGRIGQGAKISQDNAGFYTTGNFNGSANSMHIALMGDPSLRMRNLPTVKMLVATSEGTSIKLNWPAIGEPNLGYAVYRVDTITNTYLRLNANVLTDTFYTDLTNTTKGMAKYAVKAIKLETTFSGSYYNTGGAAFSNVNHLNALASINPENFNVFVYPNPVQLGSNLSIQSNLEGVKPVVITFYDLNGKVQTSQTLPNCDLGQIQITELPNEQGIYILKIEIGDQQVIKKVVINN